MAATLTGTIEVEMIPGSTIADLVGCVAASKRTITPSNSTKASITKRRASLT